MKMKILPLMKSNLMAGNKTSITKTITLFKYRTRKDTTCILHHLQRSRHGINRGCKYENTGSAHITNSTIKRKISPI